MARRKSEELFWQLGAELHHLRQEIGSARPKLASGRAWEPRIDLIEEEHRLLLKAELAGVNGEGIELIYEPERHVILLRGERVEEDLSDGNRIGIHQLEIFYGNFEREVQLPDVAIDAAGIRATYRNGILIVMIPKMERVVYSRTVKIRTN